MQYFKMIIAKNTQRARIGKESAVKIILSNFFFNQQAPYSNAVLLAKKKNLKR